MSVKVGLWDEDELEPISNGRVSFSYIQTGTAFLRNLTEDKVGVVRSIKDQRHEVVNCLSVLAHRPVLPEGHFAVDLPFYFL